MLWPTMFIGSPAVDETEDEYPFGIKVTNFTFVNNDPI